MILVKLCWRSYTVDEDLDPVPLQVQLSSGDTRLAVVWQVDTVKRNS